MKKILAWILLVCLMITAGCINNGGTVIYGNDDRVDYYQIKDSEILANAKATASMWHSWQILDLGGGQSLLRTEIFGKSRNLHYDERFWNQPIGAFCTAFLVKSNVVVTAGHCVNSCDSNNSSDNNSEKRIVFGFRMKSQYATINKIKNKDIYKIKKVIVRRVAGVDYAVMTLDRDVIGVSPLKLASKNVKKGDDVYLIGHPVGLPVKYAANAKVLSVGETEFKASLDAYGGNSGSPVFNSKNEVVGILVKGALDFIRDGDRYRSNRIKSRYFNGEGVTKVSVWRGYIPK